MAAQSKAPNTILCLNCFKGFRPRRILFSATTGELIKAKPVYRLRGRVPEYAVDSTGQIVREKHCPHCKEPLPWVSGQQEELILGLIGARYSGKSHYIASLIQRLKKDVSRNFNASIIPLDDATRRRYRREFYEPLFEDKQALPMTQSGAKSLLYRFALEETSDGTHTMGRAITLAFYDTAGEDFTKEENIAQFVSYLRHARGLIFLIDPLQIESRREYFLESGSRHKIHPAGAPDKIIGEVIDHLRKYRLLNRQGKFAIPVAIVFTKCDMLFNMINIDNPHRLWSRSDVQHIGAYNLDLHYDTKALFGQYLFLWDQGHTVKEVKANFEDHAFFGVSATGSNPDEDGNYPIISPWRVEDPLLWLLYRLNVIQGSREDEEDGARRVN